ncbi:hypothetical protein [Paraburkholderia sp. BL21I4N1]|uniref:hypothetical protein n=1 Tax=Paraburkholderia sp. BL21I4N1 TaxID=1938801 RepID=UPI000CFCAA41|nr:hypothetical protein [Paraburkholderia sp. BL21I4N1]PQV53073.1 hypothetical protein B0G83_102156 [Paraburkholderia sp. BL21I4N1]
MSCVSKPTVALHCKRLAGVLIAVALCALTGACSDDDKMPDPATTSAASGAAANDTGADNSTAVLSANPASVAPAPAALTIQSPALPASSTDPALSAAASAPLAPPVIHTVD